MNFTAAYKRKKAFRGILFALAAWVALGLGVMGAAGASQGTTLTVLLKGMVTDDGVNWRTLPISGRFTVQTHEEKVLGQVWANPTQEQRAAGEDDTLSLPDDVASVVLAPVEEDFQGGFVCQGKTVVNIMSGVANTVTAQAFARQGLFAVRCRTQDGGGLAGEAEFLVLDGEGNLCQSFVTDEEGAYTAKKALPAGEYRLVQLYSAEGTLPNPDPQAFSIIPYFGSLSDIAQISVINRPVPAAEGMASLSMKLVRPFEQEQDADTFLAVVDVIPTLQNGMGLTLHDFSVTLQPKALVNTQGNREEPRGVLAVGSLIPSVATAGYEVLLQGLDEEGQPVGVPWRGVSGQQAAFSDAAGILVTYIHAATGEAKVPDGFEPGSLTAAVRFHRGEGGEAEHSVDKVVLLARSEYTYQYPASDGNQMISAQGQAEPREITLSVPNGQAELTIKAVADVDEREEARLILTVDTFMGSLPGDTMLAAILPDGVRVAELSLPGTMRLLRTPQSDVLALPLELLQNDRGIIPIKAGVLGMVEILACDPMNLPKTAESPNGYAIRGVDYREDSMLDALLEKVGQRYAVIPCLWAGGLSLPPASPCEVRVLTGTMYEDWDQSGTRSEDEPVCVGHGVLLRGAQTGVYYGALTDEEGRFAICADADSKDVSGTLLTVLPQGALSTGSRQAGLLKQEVTSLPDTGYLLSYIRMGRITGKALLDDRGPLAQVQLNLKLDKKPIQSALSNDKGAFVFEGLAPGRYELVAESPHQRNVKLVAGQGETYEDRKLVIPLTVEYGQEVTCIVQALSQGGMGGQVLREGEPVSGMRMELIMPGNTDGTAVETDGEGNFTYGTMPEGEYGLRFSLPENVAVVRINGENVKFVGAYEGGFTLRSGEERYSRIELEPTATLDGKGTNLGGGHTVAAVSVIDQVDALTREDGSFILEGLIAGDYSLYAPLPVGMAPVLGGTWQVTQRGDMVWMPMTVEAGRRYDLPEINLVESISIHGVAYMDANGDFAYQEGEQLMSGVPVVAQRKEGDAWVEAVMGQSDEYGAYHLEGLQTGTYRVASMANAEGLYVAAVGNGPRPVGGSGVMVSEELQLATGDAVRDVADIALSHPAMLVFGAFDDSNKDGQRGKYERSIPGVRVEVLGDDGAVLASGTTDNLGEARVAGIPPGNHPLRITLPAGYAYSVKGQGQGVDVSCASGDTDEALSDPLPFVGGQATEAGVGAVPVGSLSGRVWVDENNNGVMNPEEPGMAGIQITLTGVKTKVSKTVVTDETGEYLFEWLPSDSYTLSAELPEGLLFARYTQTGGDLRSVFTVEGARKASRQFDVLGAKDVRNKNIGVIAMGTVRGVAFLDLNYNGLMDEGEPGYPKVTVELSKASNGDVMGKMATGEDGLYSFENLRGGEYRLRAIVPDNGSIFTKVPDSPEEGAGANLFVQRSGRRENTIGPIIIGNGGTAATVVGVALGATIKGTVFMDTNYEGVLRGKQQKISGVRVELKDEDGNLVDKTTTNANGNYTLEGVMPGSYSLAFLRKEGHAFTRYRPGEEGGNYVKALVGDYGVTESIAVVMGQEIGGVNAGMLRSSTVEGIFFDDLNDNGLQDPGEAGMEGVTVQLRSQDGEIDLTVPVGEDGHYFFDGVMPVTYTLTYHLPEHVELAKAAEGGNTLRGEGRDPVTEAFAVEAGTKVVRGLAGGVRLGSFAGFLFHDANANGVREPDEEAMDGLTLTFIPDRADLEEVRAKTDPSGRFGVTGLRPAGYRLAMELPAGYIFSGDIQASGFTMDTANAQQLKCPWEALISRRENAVGMVRPATLSGYVWLDEDRNGSQSPEEGFLPGLVYELIDETKGALVKKTVSDQAGWVTFTHVRPGRYTVRFTIPEQAEPAQDVNATMTQEGGRMVQRGIQVAEGQSVDAIHAGLVSRTSIGGVVMLAEKDQIPLEGLTVRLYQDLSGGDPIQVMRTDEAGAYRFNGLWPGEYAVSCELPANMIFVRPEDPNFPAGASVITRAGEGEGRSEPIQLHMARHRLDQNVVLIRPAKVSGFAWLDLNKNGLLDAGEPGIPGVTVELVGGGLTEAATTTNAFGYYMLSDVYPGAYTLRAKAYPELSLTKIMPELRVIGSCLTDGDGQSAGSDPLDVASGTVNLDFNMGYVLPEGQRMPGHILQPPPRKDWTGSYVYGAGR